ncbi:transglutaminase family protein [Chloroflexota bacterium]
MIAQVTSWFIRKWSWYAAAAFVLLLLMVFNMSFGLSDVVRGMEMPMAWGLALGALALTWLLIQLRLKTRWAITLSALVGILAVGMVSGGLGDELAAAWRELNVYRLAWLEDAADLDFSPVADQLSVFWNGLRITLTRTWNWLMSLPYPDYDAIAVLAFWHAAIWGVTSWAGWHWLKKRAPLVGGVPLLFLVAAGRALSETSPNVLLPILGATLASLVLLAQLRRENSWQAQRIGFSRLVQRRAVGAAVVLSAGLVFATWVATSLDVGEVIERLREPELEEVEQNEVEVINYLGLERKVISSQSDQVFGEKASGGMPTESLVGSGAELSEEVVMVIKVEEINPITGEIDPVRSYSNYYFRSFTYDVYTLNGWISSGGSVMSYKAGEAAVSRYSSNQRLIKQEVVNVADFGGVMHVVGDLAAVNGAYRIAWREQTPDGRFLDVFGATTGLTEYSAYSLVPIFGAAELRHAPEVYPTWVEVGFLDLPEGISERVIELAFEVTVDEPTAYGKAVALESYLRRFPYTLDVPPFPEDWEISDYFLFELQQGYCDYYATSMVVMARAVGLPARLAVGYIGGTYEKVYGEHVITADQAHSWVEVYFPEFGWVPFEPTRGRPEIARFEGRQEGVEAITEEIVELNRFKLTWRGALRGALLSVAAGGVVGLLAWPRADLWWLKRKEPQQMFAVLYRRLLWFGGRLGIDAPETCTPKEFGAKMRAMLEERAAEKGPRRHLMPASRDAAWLTAICQRAAYSMDAPTTFEWARAIQTWAVLRWQLFGALVINWVSVLILF